MKEKLIAFFKSDWTLIEKILLLADILLFGVLIGWITSPFKGSERSIYLGSHHHNNTYECMGCDDDDCEEDDWDEDDCDEE